MKLELKQVSNTKETFKLSESLKIEEDYLDDWEAGIDAKLDREGPANDIEYYKNRVAKLQKNVEISKAKLAKAVAKLNELCGDNEECMQESLVPESEIADTELEDIDLAEDDITDLGETDDIEELEFTDEFTDDFIDGDDMISRDKETRKIDFDDYEKEDDYDSVSKRHNAAKRFRDHGPSNRAADENDEDMSSGFYDFVRMFDIK